MKRLLPLLLAAILCLTAVSCEGNGKTPSAPAPEGLSQSSDSPDAAEPEPQSDAPAVVLSDAEKARLQSLIDDYEAPSQTFWALYRPSGIIFYYDFDERRLLPDQYVPDNQFYDIYVTLEATAVVLGPTDEAPTVTAAVSHDRAQTWVETELSVEDAGTLPVEDTGKYYGCHIAFRDDDNGILVFWGEDSALAYATENGGIDWEIAGSFTPPGWFHELCSAEGWYFIIGNDNGLPIAWKSSDGVHWAEKVLPPDRDYDQLFCDHLAFDGNIGFAAVPRGTNYATVDYGETWVFVKDLL